MSDWDHRFLNLAEHIAQWSKDPSTKVGAVIVRPDKTICSVGYNGFPRGMEDCNWLYDNRETKLSRVVHAEINALIHAKESINGYTLYTSTFLPCDRCAVQFIQAGIKRVVTKSKDERDYHALSRSYFKECGIEAKEY